MVDLLLERCKSCWRNLIPGCTDVVKNDRAELTFLHRKENPGILLSLLPSHYVELLWVPGAGVAHATHLAICQQQLCSPLELTSNSGLNCVTVSVATPLGVIVSLKAHWCAVRFESYRVDYSSGAAAKWCGVQSRAGNPCAGRGDGGRGLAAYMRLGRTGIPIWDLLWPVACWPTGEQDGPFETSCVGRLDPVPGMKLNRTLIWGPGNV